MYLNHSISFSLRPLRQRFVRIFKDKETAGLNQAPETVKFYESVMLLWQRYESLLPLTVFRMRYEDLIDDLEGTARELTEFLELPWDNAMLNFHRHAATRNIITPSYSQVTQKIYTHARYRWLRYEKYLNPMLSRLQPFIDEFGYGESK